MASVLKLTFANKDDLRRGDLRELNVRLVFSGDILLLLSVIGYMSCCAFVGSAICFPFPWWARAVLILAAIPAALIGRICDEALAKEK